MYAIALPTACAFCSLFFGTVDWHKPYDAACFQLGIHSVVLNLHHDTTCDYPSHNAKERKELRKVVGNKVIACVGEGFGREPHWLSQCYVADSKNKYINVADELQRRGF